jgi:SAM-dependent methyltransferase
MTFAIPATDYDRFMGRYSLKLAPLFADFVGVSSGMRVLDVGCGPGALTLELARRVGEPACAGVEPSPSFVEACRSRLPNADIRSGGAELLPWDDSVFDAALAQLVLSFVSDPEQTAREMRRVVRAGGRVGACMWHEGASLELGHVFWQAAGSVDPALRHADDRMRFRRPGEIVDLFKQIGLRDVCETFLDVRASYQDFADFWDTMVHGAGGIGVYMAAADGALQAAIREACRARLGNPTQSFELGARACAVHGRV